MTRTLDICIATCDIVGPIRNGGIGTAYYQMALALARAGHRVTVLYALGEFCEQRTIAHWEAEYARQRITFVPLPPQDVLVSRSDLARVYVMRDSQVRGRIRAMHVEDSNQEVGAFLPGEFLCWERTPGRALLSFSYQGPHIDGGELEGLYSLDAEAGHAYYLLVHLERRPEDPQLSRAAGHPEVELLEPELQRRKRRLEAVREVGDVATSRFEVGRVARQ